MDALVAAALEEISAEGPSGCKLQKLWGALQGVAYTVEIPLDAEAKQVVWQGLVDVPGLLLLPPKRTAKDVPIPASDPVYQNLEEVERAGFLILAPEGLRDGCIGAYDLKYSDARLSDIQRGALERLALSRHEGVTQNELAKEFKKGGNAMFYVVRNLEVRGLLTRQSTIVRKKDSENNKQGSIVATNLVRITRFAKNLTLGSHQRFEILRPSTSHDPDSTPLSGDAARDEDGSASRSNTYVVNDDFPAMKAICEKIEQAAEKVLVVSDIKLTLGYRHAAGHRTWRRLVKRLQDAGLVEVFSAQIDRKVVTCIRSLKPFDAKALNGNNEDVECETSLRGGKRGQVTEQLTELPIDHQIYENIDNAGPEGIHMMEVLKRLGLHNKRNYYRVTNMMARKVVVSEAETHKRSTLYRLRTPRNAVAASDDHGAQNLLAASGSSVNLAETLPAERCSEVNVSNDTLRRFSVSDKDKSEEQTDEVLERAVTRLAIPEVGLQETAIASLELHSDLRIPATTEALTLATQPPPRPGHQYPCFAASRTNAQREQRIYQRLKAETFALRVELHRWLEDIEARKGIMMDRKTLSRVLQKMQSKGQCKIMKLSMPGLTNCGRKRESEVVLLPEVEVTPDLVKCLHERVRKFDSTSRGQGVSRAKSLLGVPVLTGVIKRMNHRKKSILPESIPVKGKSLQVNGFIPAKMVRVRMLHYYLWFYVSGLPENQNQAVQGRGDVASEEEMHFVDESSKSKIFALTSAIHAMPLELYLQIIGSTKDVERVAERCKQGIRLCDIPADELKAIIEQNSSGRLSWLVDVLCRLQLVQLKMGEGPVVRKKMNLERTLAAPEASLSYALELHPSIEEPASQAFPSFSSDVFSVTPGEWHNFSLTSKDELDGYWQTLEYFYSGADPVTGKRHFPGSKVPEVFGLRSWTSLRIMSIEQRTELLKRIGAGGPETRKSAFECAKIAKDLNLTLEQVLRVSYEKNRRLRLIELAKAAVDNGNAPGGTKGQYGLKQASKKRASLGVVSSEPPHVRAYKRQRQLLLDASATTSAATAAPQHDDEQEPGGNNEDENQLFLDEKDEDEDDFEGGGAGETPASFMTAVATLRPSRAKRFPWSDRLDRILIVCYAKQRATLGARHQRVDWGSMPDLPAPPQACRRRMSQLRADPTVRKAVLKFCALLACRYLEFLEDNGSKQGKGFHEEVEEPVPGCKNLGLVLSSESSLPKKAVETNMEGLDSAENLSQEGTENVVSWNPMEDTSVLLGLEEVMRCKIEAQARRLAGSIGRGATKNKIPTLQFHSVQTFTSYNLSPVETSSDALHSSLPTSPGPVTYDASTTTTVLNCTATGRSQAVRTRVRHRQIPSPPSLLKPSTDEVVQKSLSVANAVELLKLVMLNAGPRDPESLVDALKRFKHGDIVTAFNYLRRHELVAIGHDRKPFVLSAKFHHNCSASRFPSGSGEEARSIEVWLRQHSRALQTEWVTLSPEQTCGQLLHLFGLVAGGEFVLAPFLPDEGIGESEEYTNMITGTKRKADSDGDQRSLKPKLQQYESHQYLSLRRERGYPGIRVAVHGASSQSQDLVPLGTGIESDPQQPFAVGESSFADEVAIVIPSDMTKDAGSTTVEESPPTCIHPMDSKEQLLEKCIGQFSTSATTIPFEQRSKLDPTLLKAFYYAIESANPEGLRMDELVEVIPRKIAHDGNNMDAEQAEGYVEALQKFKLVQKVNAFDHVRVVTPENAAQFMLFVRVQSPTMKPLTAGPTMEAKSYLPFSFSYNMEVRGKNNSQPEDELGTPYHCLREGEASVCRNSGEFGPISTTGQLNQIREFPQHQGVGGVQVMNTTTPVATASRHTTRTKLVDPGGSDVMVKHWVNANSRTLGVVSTSDKNTAEMSGSTDSLNVRVRAIPMRPWLTADGSMNMKFVKAMTRRVMGTVTLSPGIAEDQLVENMEVLNPQSAREFLQMLEADGHLLVRPRLQPHLASPPRLLRQFINVEAMASKPKLIRHYFPNPFDARLL